MNSLVQRQVESHAVEIRELCQRLAVRELRIFGSAAAGDAFSPSGSDIDILVEFSSPDQRGIADRFMDLADGLESIFQRRVDLVTRASVKNPVFRSIVEETSVPVYAA
jgi:uncharacterized protein